MSSCKSACSIFSKNATSKSAAIPIQFDIDVLILFSANPSTYNRSGKVIPQLKDRIGSIIHTHYPLERDLGIQIVEQEVEGKADDGNGRRK